MTAAYRDILDRFPGIRLAVVGDCMVDRFLWGRVDRISPEAPVPVVRLERETVKLGGAANVAHNIRCLGAEVILVGVVGRDEAAATLMSLLQERSLTSAGIVPLQDRPTTLKTRIIAHHQQVVRADAENDAPLATAEIDKLLDSLRTMGPYDGILLSDYGKGVLTPSSLARLIEYGRSTGAVIAVDPKNGDFSQYRGVTTLTPNQREAELACAMTISDHHSLAEAGKTLLARTESKAVLITRGEHGMALYERDGGDHHLPTEATEVYDVTGAGDTVIATYTAALASGASFLEAANLANHAAGLAVRELGTAAPSVHDIAEALGI
jgi:D-beta-D-heptose 7-phosphate kinase/D-beta-D-heptose 1-phosphate adenosyltransferase